MTPQQLWHIARRWLWLFGLATVIAAGAAYLVSNRLPKVYSASTKLLVAPALGGPSGDLYSRLLAADRLSYTFSELLKTRPVVEAAAKDAGVEGTFPFGSVLKQVDVKHVRDSQLLQVSVRAYNPDLAAKLANSLAGVFILQTQANQASQTAAARESTVKQIERLLVDIADRTRSIDALRALPPSATRDGESTRLQAEVTQLQLNYAAAVRSYEDLRLADARGSELLAVVEPATASPRVLEPNTTLNVLLAGFVGLMLAVGAAALIEFLDDRLFSPERIARLLGLHTLGTVPLLPKDAPRTVDEIAAPALPATRNGGGKGWYYGVSQVAEAFRLLRTHLQFVAVGRPLRTLLVTSSDVGDGKSLMAANLAVVAAQAGRKVLLVDADLRRPSLHGLFDVQNRLGLTSLLVAEQGSATRALLPTRVEGLWLLPSGPLPPNPSELLASHRMRDCLAELKELADLVIIDSPPVLIVSDPVVLSNLADGTLFVVNAQRTRGRRAAHAVATLQKAGANVLGAVLNRTTGDAASRYQTDTDLYQPRTAGTLLPSPGAATSPAGARPADPSVN